MDKLKALNGFTNLLAMVLIFVGAALFLAHEKDGAQMLIGGGLVMLRTGAEHASDVKQ